MLRKIAFTLLGFALLILALNFGVSYWVKKKLPTLIGNQKDFPYNISYERMDLDLMSGSFTIHNMFVAPKDSIAAAVKNGVFAKAGTVAVRGLKLWQLYKNNKIIVSSVLVDEPEVILYHREKKVQCGKRPRKTFPPGCANPRGNHTKGEL